jgi:hypothetical protein
MVDWAIFLITGSGGRRSVPAPKRLGMLRQVLSRGLIRPFRWSRIGPVDEAESSTTPSSEMNRLAVILDIKNLLSFAG